MSAMTQKPNFMVVFPLQCAARRSWWHAAFRCHLAGGIAIPAAAFQGGGVL
jgi:hypothetical protein